MIETTLPREPAVWAPLPAADPALLLEQLATLHAVIALLSGRYRLGRREVRQLLQDLWPVRVSLGALVRQEHAQGATLAPVVEEVRAAVQQAYVANGDGGSGVGRGMHDLMTGVLDGRAVTMGPGIPASDEMVYAKDVAR